MYSFESRVRYSESDESGRLSVQGILNYFQDCSTFQSEDLKLGLSYLGQKKRAWWLSGWQVVIDRQPLFGERIRVSTWPYGFRGIYGYRNFIITDLEGNSLVRADSTWFFYDLEKGSPARVTPEEIRGYGSGEEKLSLPPAPRRIEIPKDCRTAPPVTVLRHHLDTNRHVNNAQYVAIARELLPERFSVRELRAEYRKAAVLGDVMIPRIGRLPEGYVVSLQKEGGEVFANVWLQEAGQPGSRTGTRKRDGEDEGHD